MTNYNTTDGEFHLFANDGTDWRSTASPVSTKEAREADKALDDDSREGEGFSGTNEVRLASTIVEGSEGSNGAEDESESEDESDK